MYRSYKRFIGYSTAFRQWKADSHCNKIHGYAFCFKVWFEGELDERGWVIDFGCFKRNGVKEWLKNLFDHNFDYNIRVFFFFSTRTLTNLVLRMKCQWASHKK